MLSTDIRKLKPEVNIGTLGHVDHGKSTLVQALTGVWTSRHSLELMRNITIKLGYANMDIYECPSCDPPYNLSSSSKCPNCGSESKLVRKISFVDAPGHEVLMTTMLSGAAVMDGALLVISADEKCPQPQTREHLYAAMIMGIDRLVVVQNKIDLVTRDRALESYREIKEFLRGTPYENAPIVPVSAQRKVNTDVLIYLIEKHIPTPPRRFDLPPLMPVIRSFDVNKPGTNVEDLIGGVVGGSILRGLLRVGDEVDILPGAEINIGKKKEVIPLSAEVRSIRFDSEPLEEATAGGLIAVGTSLDPALTKGDKLQGNILGKGGTLPKPVHRLTLDYSLLERVVGIDEIVEVKPLTVGEMLALNIGATFRIAKVLGARGKRVELELESPAVAEQGQRVAISRRFQS
ncbi:MAG: translation initiation factor IF-2 subunit gamma, partial [Thermoproteota archaeon]